MSFFREVIKKVFNNNEEQPKKRVRVQEKMNITEAFREGYHNWLQTDDAVNWLGYMHKSIQLELNGIEGPKGIQCFKMDATRGFAILNKDRRSASDFSYLLHHFYTILNKSGYIAQRSGRVIEDQGAFVQTKEGYYMKPNPYLGMGEGNKLNQLYGNTSLELTYADKEASFIKVVTTWYSDHMFDEALPHQQLLDLFFLLEKPGDNSEEEKGAA